MPRITTVRSRPKFLWCAVLVVVLAGCQTGRSDPDNNGRAGTASAQATTGWVAARVDVGEHSLNLNCKGSGSPAIVFESGLGGNLGTWFQTSVAHAFPSVRTCAYDRVNTGTSDRSAARYAGTHPAEVSGLVLIDPSLPTQAELYDLIPQQERAAAIAGDEQTPENVNFSDTLEQAKVLVPKIPDVPVLVLAATSLGDLPPSWPAADIEAARTNALHDFSTALPRGELRYVDSGHFIHTEQPKLVISEIQRILENVR
jgi:pimeloyl-ACP methyl ester carboxylesterase